MRKVFLVAVLGALPALAQDFQQIAPKPVPRTGEPAPQLVAPSPPPPIAGRDDQKVISALKGLVLVNAADKIQKSGRQDQGIVMEGLTLADQPDLKAKLAPFIGKPATFGDLKQIARIVTDFYSSHGHPFMDMVFPAQDIDSGTVQAVVTEFHLGKIKPQGNRWFSDDMLKDYVRVQPGQPIDLPRLNEDIAALNSNPFRQVAVTAEKGEGIGETDLLLKTQDRLPLRIYAGYDDYGTANLGYDRFSFGVNWGSVFGTDQQLSYQLTAGSNFFNDTGHASFAAHSLTWSVPLPWRDRLLIFGAYSEARPMLGPDLGVLGISGQASVRYVLPLSTGPLSFVGDAVLTHGLQFGYDFKTSNNDLSFGGEAVSSVTTEVDQFPLIYNATLSGDLGAVSLSNTLVWSPGNLSSQNTAPLFQAQANTPYADAHYVYDTLDLTATVRLPYDATLLGHLTGQLADHNLLPSEQLGAGGHDSVRGYDERAANGSEGVLLSAELRSPAFSPLGAHVGEFLDYNTADQAQLLAFWDYGQVRDKEANPGGFTSLHLSSIGVGVRYSISRYLDLRLDYGHQIIPLPGANLANAVHVSLTVGY